VNPFTPGHGPDAVAVYVEGGGDISGQLAEGFRRCAYIDRLPVAIENQNDRLMEKTHGILDF
jgi:hypothetical protein